MLSLGAASSAAAASDVTGHVYVNDNTAGENTVAAFDRHSDGPLTPLPGSTVPLPRTANPGDILFNSTGTNLVGVEVGTSDPSTFLIDSFVVGKHGSLAAAAGSPFPAQAAGPFGSEFSSADPS